MWQRLAQWPGLVFVLVFAWKLALLVFTAQPVPANDSFFYDGAVVNFLLNGKYTNPSLVLTLPISGNEVFSAYPPFYQFVLLGWMKIFGTSALAAMWLHLALYAFYMTTLFATLQRLKAPVWCIHIAGLFLFTNTFHDRPDSLAHALGMLAIYTWLRARKNMEIAQAAGKFCPGLWPPVLLALLGLAAGPVIGAMYLFIICELMLQNFCRTRKATDLLPVAVMICLPPAAICAIAMGRPDWWAGFMEHARQTPSLSNVHAPEMLNLLKVLRTVPGVLAVICLTAVLWSRIKRTVTNENTLTVSIGVVTLLAVGAVVLGCLLFLTANLVHAAAYLQPLIVACFLSVMSPILQLTSRKKLLLALFGSLALLSSIRAIGLTTWGVACARDVTYSDAIRATARELDTVPQGQPVIVSAAYLYEATRHKNIRAVHSDWLGPMNRGAAVSFTDALIKLKPRKLLLTQFDYYRRYEIILGELKTRPELADLNVSHMAKTLAPDSFPSMQKVVQHVSWSPVIVTLSWKSPSE